MQKEITQDFGYLITQRWLFAVDRILGNRANGKVTQQMIGDVVGINGSNINRLRRDPERRVSIDACARLCDHYKISAAWLLLDIGDMFGNSELMSAYQLLEKRVSNVEDAIKQLERKQSVAKKRR